MKVSTVLAYVRQFEEWARADEMRGCAHPDDRDEIHERYKHEKKRLIRAIKELSE